MRLLSYAKRIVVDSGPLFLHAASVFSKESGLEICLRKAVRSLAINELDARHFSIVLDRFFSTAKEILVTSYVLAEICNLAEVRLKLKNSKLRDFVGSYKEFLLKLREYHVEKDQLIELKKAWKLCFTDSSLALASRDNKAQIITIDNKLVGWCRSQGIDAKHAYYDIYLSS